MTQLKIHVSLSTSVLVHQKLYALSHSKIRSPNVVDFEDVAVSTVHCMWVM